MTLWKYYSKRKNWLHTRSSRTDFVFQTKLKHSIRQKDCPFRHLVCQTWTISRTALLLPTVCSLVQFILHSFIEKKEPLYKEHRWSLNENDCVCITDANFLLKRWCQLTGRVKKPKHLSVRQFRANDLKLFVIAELVEVNERLKAYTHLASISLKSGALYKTIFHFYRHVQLL